MKNSMKERTSFDKFTPEIPDRIGSKKGNGKGETDSDTSTGKDLTNDVHKDKDYTEDATIAEKSESDADPETKRGAIAIVTQPAKDEICSVPEIKSGSELGPASVINMKIDTDEDTDRIKVKEESEDTDNKELRSNSSESIDDTPDDEYLEKGDEKPAESESIGYTKVEGGEKNEHDGFDRPNDETCESTQLKKSTLNHHTESEITDKEEKRAYSSIDGAPDDESFEKGTEKSAK